MIVLEVKGLAEKPIEINCISAIAAGKELEAVLNTAMQFNILEKVKVKARVVNEEKIASDIEGRI